ncbi:hypothetical protein C4579_04015 [Candidatus Microgenomates bacterium]|nr:MAG: hypothetical protein C4579_04015 [Candidatus Microgenomates bacterium]
MLCPACNAQLLPQERSTNVGRVVIDVCPNCGGIWTDTGEANFISSKDMADLPLPADPNAVEHIPQELLCPKDRNALVAFHGDSIPQDIKAFRCTQCQGYWFPYHELQGLKNAQKVKIDYFKTWHVPLPKVTAVLLPLLILFIGAGIVATVRLTQQPQDTRTKAQGMISTPIVAQIDDTHVLITFTTQVSTRTNIRYWQSPEAVIVEKPVSQEAKIVHAVQIEFREGYVYSYQLIALDPNEFVSPTYEFRIENGALQIQSR